MTEEVPPKGSIEDGGPHKIHKEIGVTPTERLLKKLCDRTFLSLWHYPCVYKDQGKRGTGDGTEICDLLVVFENHVIIFSDRCSVYPNTKKPEVNWRRWFERAILDPARHIWGAESWLKRFPQRVFINRSCTSRLPIEIPKQPDAKYHRIIIANGVADICREKLGGSGSLMIHPDSANIPSIPFSIGDIDPKKGFVHVFNDSIASIMLKTLDTLSDFVRYLETKELFIRSGKLVAAPGEEDLLAYYLKHVNTTGHYFRLSGADALALNEGFYDSFISSSERKSQIEADRISYAWDKLIERVAEYGSSPTLKEGQTQVEINEKLLRYLAKETRLRRRFLSLKLHEVLDITQRENRALSRLIPPERPSDPYYLFIGFPHEDGKSYDEYVERRRSLLMMYLMGTKARRPEIQAMIGIATQAGFDEIRSEDVMLLDGAYWREEDQKQGEEILKVMPMWENPRVQRMRIEEYPHSPKMSLLPPSIKFPRNDPCSCGSGKKFKKCCGKNK